MKNFDLFRLNCFLNDTKANDYKLILVSLICELIFDNNNEPISIDDCYKYLINDLKFDVDKDFFNSVITNQKVFEYYPLQNEVLLKLTSKKFGEIHEKISDHLIDNYIEKFIQKNNLPSSYLESIKALLFQAVYENINTFSTTNLSSLISTNLRSHYKNDEIEVFNAFLEDDDYQKNSAVYTVFLKATEFAIITSGKGIKEFSKNIFQNKIYFLDTNILFRLLGIGGRERQIALQNLLKSCTHQGIKFEYTAYTFQELKTTLSGSVKYLKYAEQKYDILMLGELTESDPSLFNEDFILHYSKLRITGEASTPEQYELRLLANFKNLEQQLGFSLVKGDIKIEVKQKEKLSDYLHKEKRKSNYGTRYTKKAANIDAYNVLCVRKIRGENNHNYADVKSFYLSTDRTLNDILSKEEEIKIPETILPSQLFILHHPYTSNGEKVDYELFLQFVKRRTTEFHFKGGEVLTFIDTIRKQTNSKDELRNILHVFADQRYEVSNNHNIEERKIHTIYEAISTVIDKKIKIGDEARSELEDIKINASDRLQSMVRRSRTAVRLLDIFIILLILVLALLLKELIHNLYYLIFIILALEIIKFIITSKTRAWPLLWKIILIKSIKKSSYYKLTKDEKYINNGLEEYNKVNGDIWKRQ